MGLGQPQRRGWFAPAAFSLVAFGVGCGGGSSSPGGSGSVPTANPRGSGSPTAGPTATATAAPTSPPTPTPSPTPTGVGYACRTTADPLPGTYAGIVTEGNVSGSSYTQIAGGGAWNAAAYSIAPTPTPTASPTPTPSPSPTRTPTLAPSLIEPGKHHHPSPSPSPSASPTPTGSPMVYIAYTGAYAVTGFTAGGPGGPSSIAATNGCVLLLTTKNGAPIQPNGNFNASGQGTPFFGLYVVATSSPVASGTVTSLSISNLGPSSGNGTFVLDTKATGTITIQASQVVTEDRVRRMLGR